MPSSASCARVAVSRRSASSPACTVGCSVLTRPSRHLREAGELARPGSPARRAPRCMAAVEPVETISTPAASSARASSASPVLSYTLTSARRIGRRVARWALLASLTGS